MRDKRMSNPSQPRAGHISSAARRRAGRLLRRPHGQLLAIVAMMMRLALPDSKAGHSRVLYRISLR